ncbi:glycoside hydrolase family 1 protein [Enterococcus hulanensis]|uniref:glycoside hydrolase family 1 protein n=1 Tax=Enterococcus hulanensis TaxID=2559929 RepID=UPI0010F976F1|nr:glycoside hydrolase family 1 protein [Enterococcus hulanensis]
MKQNFKFDKDFLWGASTSAYQIEGAWDFDNKGKSVQDVKEVFENTSDFKVCVDHYNRYKEDIKLFSEMGLKAYRFSIAWTRILPNGKGKSNKKGIDFYHRLIDECLKYDIIPIATMFHFDLPYALEKEGGWSNPATIDAFEEFSRIVFSEYGEKVPYFLSINEQNVMILHGNVIGTSLEQEKQWKGLYQQNHYMQIAQAKATILCHELAPNAKIGPAPNISPAYPKSCSPEDYLAAMNATAIRNWLYLDLSVYGQYNFQAWNYLKDRDYLPHIEDGDMELLKQAKPDFIAVNYYNTMTVEENTNKEESSGEYGDQQIAMAEEGYYRQVNNPYLKETDFGWEIDPVGFRVTLREVYDRYKLPLLISENGIGTYDKLEEDGTIHDEERIFYYEQHIAQLAKAVEDGVPVIGYCPWSAIDLISTHQGIRKRYGFVYVNRSDEELSDLKRYKKDSFYWYKELIKNRGTF